VFGSRVPDDVPRRPERAADAANTWPTSAYDEKARKVASLFRENFKKYEAQASAEFARRSEAVGETHIV